MKNAKRNTIILLIVAIIVSYFVVKDDFQSIVDNLILANKWLILLCIGLVFCYWILRALSLYFIVRKYKKRIKFKKMFHQTLITQFFNGVTPFATGGEPMQVYSMTRSGVSFSKATLASLINICSFQIVIISLDIMVVFGVY